MGRRLEVGIEPRSLGFSGFFLVLVLLSYALWHLFRVCVSWVGLSALGLCLGSWFLGGSWVLLLVGGPQV